MIHSARDMSEQAILEGYISIEAAFAARSRPIHALILAKDRWDARALRLEQAARSIGANVTRKERAEIDALAQGTTHGGVLAIVGERRFAPLAELGRDVARPFIAMLDGIEDPFNFGSAVRSLYAAGVHGLVLRARNWMSAAGTVARASAGASELIPVAVADDPQQAVRLFRARGLTIACATAKRARPIYEADLAGPLFLLIGGEKRGIHKSLLEQADIRLRVPYGRAFPQALDTASATAVLAFEVMRQRRPRDFKAG